MSSVPQSQRQKAEKRGRSAEIRAGVMLRLKGFRILEKRWKCRLGELDLVVQRGNTVAFVEVKARKTRDDAIASVDERQRRRIVAAAHQWLCENPDHSNCDCRFDIVLVTPYEWPKHMPNAFMADDQ